MTFERKNGHRIAEGGGRDKGVDDYDRDDFESESEVGSEVETEEEEGQSSFRGGERSDAEADRHDDDTFGDTQELDSSITNQYLRQLRYNMTVCQSLYRTCYIDRMKCAMHGEWALAWDTMIYTLSIF